MATEYPGTLSNVQRLKGEFQQLVADQEEAFRTATFCGMTPEVAKECEDRGARITKIGDQITDLSNQTAPHAR